MNIVQALRRYDRAVSDRSEIVALELAKQLRIGGHHADCFCCPHFYEDSEKYVDSIEVQTIDPKNPDLGLQKDIDIIHLHEYGRLGKLIRKYCIKNKKPYVVSLHNGPGKVLTKELKSFLDRSVYELGKIVSPTFKILRDASGIICVNPKDMEFIRTAFPDKLIANISNGVHPDTFNHGNANAFKKAYGIPLDAKILLCAGKICEGMNQLAAIQMFKELAKIHPTLHLVFVGVIQDKIYFDQILNCIHKNRLENDFTHISWFERHNNMLVNAYHAADVFLFPATEETFSREILEAWASKKPVVATEIEGTTQMVRDGENGFLYPHHDLTLGANLINELLSDWPLRNRLACSGRETVCSNFTWEQVAQKHLSLYESAKRTSSSFTYFDAEEPELVKT